MSLGGAISTGRPFLVVEHRFLAWTNEGGKPFHLTKRRVQMFLALFFILLVMWLLGFVAFHVAGGLIHLLLIIAAISLVVHFFRGRSAA
jgi:Family of unknown function (DUF5670)